MVVHLLFQLLEPAPLEPTPQFTAEGEMGILFKHWTSQE